ncbi:hypothetical protein [Cyanobium sp. Morenito 9A2]|uniref:hypothetical protein n=1 Tax=Cyanobium sp. Morenito 9A2 TaxID=2823718 RepID=UPI0020CE99E1|nr:hypothetical protein [Cyanobium sp. Morenito 9A2]MCP9848570.1 hypothetical protein [Cyanobium sp. Morenito 9A2]
MFEPLRALVQCVHQRAGRLGLGEIPGQVVGGFAVVADGHHLPLAEPLARRSAPP